MIVGKLKTESQLIGTLYRPKCCDCTNCGGSGGNWDDSNVTPLGEHSLCKRHRVSPMSTTTTTIAAMSYYETHEEMGQTTEQIVGLKSLENPSKLISKTFLKDELYSLPGGIKDSAKVSKSETRLKRNCGRVVIDETFSGVSEWILSGADDIASGYFCAKFDFDCVVDRFKENTTRIYCNRLSATTSIKNVTTASIVIDEYSNICLVLPTGTCEETNTALHEWLKTHPIDIIYELAIPYELRKSSSDKSTLENNCYFDSLDIPVYKGGQFGIGRGAHYIMREATNGIKPYTYSYCGNFDIWNNSNTGEDYSSVEENSDGCCFISTSDTGGYHPVALRVTDSAGNYRTKVFILSVVDALTNSSNISKKNIDYGASVTFRGLVNIDSIPFMCLFAAKHSTESSYTVIKDYVDTAVTMDWTPSRAGKYTLLIRVKDVAGKTATKTFILIVNEQEETT